MEKYIANLSKGTIFTKEMYEQQRKIIAKENRIIYKETGIRYFSLGVNWEKLRINPEKYGLKKLEGFKKTKSSKYSAIDVLNMIKNGKTIEEIEPMLYSKVRYIYFEKL